MIFRCTAQFIRSFDKLVPERRKHVINVLGAFKLSPRLPSADAWYLKSSRGVWALPVGEDGYITYHFETGEGDDNVCVFRHAGFTPRALPAK